MNLVEKLLGRLQELNVRLSLEGDRLKVDAPRGVLDGALKAELVRHGDELKGLVRDMPARLAGGRRLAQGIDPVPRTPEMAVSHAQQRMWLLKELDPDSTAYHIPSAFRLEGRLDVQAVERTLADLVGRHESLRLRFVTTNGVLRCSVEPEVRVDVEHVDLSRLPGSERDLQAQRLIVALARRPFDIEAGPLLHAALYRIAPDVHVFCFVFDHIVSDGLSVALFVGEFQKVYAAHAAGVDARLPGLPVQYLDYVAWQRKWLEQGALDRHLAFWKQELGPLPPVLQLPTDHPRTGVRTYRGARTVRRLPLELAAGLKALARSERATLYMVMLAAYQVLLYRYTGATDLAVGSAVANRSRPEVERVFGLFANNIVIRADLSGHPTVQELISRVAATAQKAYAHQDMPFDVLVEALAPRRDRDHPPVFQTMFTMHSLMVVDFKLPGLECSSIEFQAGTSRFDLAVDVFDLPDGLRAYFEYNTDLFDLATIDRMAVGFGRLLEGFVAMPSARIDDLPLLGEEERRQLVLDWNRTPAASLPLNACFTRLFEGVAARLPDALAVAGEHGSLTYRELNARANAVARRIREHGVGAGTRVAVCLERSIELLVALLGVQKAGGAYVPLDPGFPSERLQFMLADSGVDVLITARGASDAIAKPAGLKILDLDAEEQVLAAASPENLPQSAAPGDPAYVIYTSGSTGRPKGVVVSHGSLLNFLESMRGEPGLLSTDVLAAVTTISFDIAALELYLPLLVGARVELIEREVAVDGSALAARLERCGATVLQATPATWRLLVQAGWRGGEGFKTLCGGESLPRELAEELLQRSGQVWNLYGPTETTVWSTLQQVETGSGPVGIGRPIANTQIYVVDPAGQPTPIGVPGEIWIGGAGVALGYHQRPELTAEKFVADPFRDDNAARLYRTGDLGRWRADGRLEHLGRLDDQVKIRGFRIELGEIEAVLARHPAVRQCVVNPWEPGAGDRRLVAYVVLQPDAALLLGEMREFLKRQLPDYMVPTLVMALQALPLTPNAKVDRRALSAPQSSGAEVEPTDAPAQGATEQAVSTLWREVLQVNAVGRNDDFFELGGHSLLATQVAARLRDAFQIDLPLVALFEASKLKDLALRVDEATRDQARPIPLLPRTGFLPSSFAQERFWFLEHLDPGTSLYNVPAVLRFRGKLVPELLEASLMEIARRHEMLRTTFQTVEDQLVQVVHPSSAVEMPRLDLRDCPTDSQESQALEYAREEANRPFVLRTGPFLRALLIRQADELHLLVMTFHHIVADGWSVEVFKRELLALYRNGGREAEASLPALPIQYADFAAWQRHHLETDSLKPSLEYWTRQLEGAPPALDLPTLPRPLILTFKGATCVRRIDSALVGRLRCVGGDARATLFMVLLAGFNVLMSRLSGQDDICIGVPVAGRQRTELEPLIGMFVGNLVIRTKVAPDATFRELLEQVRDNCLAAYAHQDVPFELVVQALAPERDLSRTPLFQVLFNMLSFEEGELESPPGLQVEALQLSDSSPVPSKFDLTLYLREEPSGLMLAAVYNSNLFDPESVGSLLGQFTQLLELFGSQAEAKVFQVSLVTASDASRLPNIMQRLESVEPADDIVSRFRFHVARSPDSAAVISSNTTLSYLRLEQESNRLARYLIANGIAREHTVAIFADRSEGLVWALLGVLKAGGAFVIFDPALPSSRLQRYMQATRPRAWIELEGAGPPPSALIEEGQQSILARACWPASMTDMTGGWQSFSADPPDRKSGADDLAYVVFTSGSTGEPKSVAGTHGPLSHFFEWHARTWALGPGDRFSVLSGLAHDPLLRDTLGALWAGATICMPDQTRMTVSGYLAQWLSQQSISVVNLTPAMAELLSIQGPAVTPPLRDLRLAFFGGESLQSSAVTSLTTIAPDVSCVNYYGTTETPQAIAFHPIRAADVASGRRIAIGRGIEGVQLLVINAAGGLCGIGELGELSVRTPFLSRGYLNDPDLTALRFVPNPVAQWHGDRLYRTGDLGRYRSDGSVDFVGRRDRQVKLRGYRIEPGEIEAALCAVDGIREAAVCLRGDVGTEPRLVAYVTVAPGPLPDLRRALKERLPSYMVPAHFVTLDQIPLTPNGKVDLRALLLLAQTVADLSPPRAGTWRAAASSGARMPVNGRPCDDEILSTLTERAVARIWSAVLEAPDVRSDDNFFDLGGHSLLAARVLSRLRAATGVELPLRSLFESPTVAEFAARVDAARDVHHDSAADEREEVSF